MPTTDEFPINAHLTSTACREGPVGLASKDVQNLYSIHDPCLSVFCVTFDLCSFESRDFQKRTSLSDSFWHFFQSTLIMSIACILEILAIVCLLLLISGIEPNPGPPKILTVNCRGLSSRVKLLSTIGKLRKECEKNESCIIFLQETHLNDVELIADIWSGTKVIRSFFSSSQRGTAIILKGPFVINALESDPEGRFCFANVSHELLPELSDNTLTLVNVYAPNNHKDSRNFFCNIFTTLDQFNRNLMVNQTPDMIVAGDFNFIFDVSSDCQNRKTSKDEETLSEFVSDKFYELELWDVVQSSKLASNFTWRRDITRSRIDYIFASSSIAGKVSKFNNKWHLIKTDHAAIVIEL